MNRTVYRILRVLVAELLSVSLCLSLFGCLFGETREQREERLYAEAIEQVFAALDEGNANALRQLFSEEAQQGDPDLDGDITRLMEVYGGSYVTHGFDGLLHSSASFEPEGRTHSVSATTPVEAGGAYYWVYLRLTYQCDPDPAQVGITELEFYTADEWSLFLYDEDRMIEESLGLTVYADKTLDREVRCIDGNPIQYTPREAIDPDEAVEQLNKTDSFSAFKERFGEPVGSWVCHYYPLPDEDGEARWLRIGDDERDDRVYSATVVDRFEYLETLWEGE